MLMLTRRALPALLAAAAAEIGSPRELCALPSRELFTLCVIAGAVSVAYGSAKLFDVSFALGAFFAGMMMRESEFSHRAAEESRAVPARVERWFGELTTKKLRRGAHRSVRALNADIRAWIDAWNEDPKPFVWTKTADQILESIARYCNRINASGH